MLHALVREHLDAFIRFADERYTRPLPRYVKRAFEEYLRCGLPEHGLLRLRCDDCGHDRVVAFSCKQRGTCPSCAGRTMANTAAHLVDRVLPNVPIRQWVLSLPFELRRLAAKRPDVVAAIDRILFREIERMLRRSHGPRDGRAGAITFIQRFGGSLNLHVHFHVLVLEGLFTREGTREGTRDGTRDGEKAPPVFHESLAPTKTELLAVVTRVRTATLRWLARRGLDRPAAHDADVATAVPNEADALDALDACAAVAIQPGLFDKLDDSAPAGTIGANDDEPAAVGRKSVALDGFNLHAAVSVGADDDVARERLVRYCARPPFALERLSMLPDGRIAYRIKQPRRNATHRVLEPLELLARIAALIPPPRHPFMRYHGVLAPSAKWRSLIVPRLDDTVPHAHPRASSPSLQPQVGPARPATNANAEPRAHVPAVDLAERSTTAPRVRSSQQPARYALVTPKHRQRLGDGELLARTPRLDWAKLLRRTFAEDVLVCPRCTGRARIIGAIHNPSDAQRLVTAIGESALLPRELLVHEPELDETPPPSFPAAEHADDDEHQPPPESAPDPEPPDD